MGGTTTIYGPNETITVSSSVFDQYMNNSRQVTLYAVWVAKETNVTMQTFNSTNYAAYNSAPIGTVIALEDTRDNNVYAVAKLADGKWWMIENLRLDNTATITTANTHNPLTANNSVALKIDYANNTIADHLASSNNTWCVVNGSSCVDQTMLNTNNTNRSLMASYSGSGSATYYQWYSYGNYYNWYSATAGNGTYDSFNNNSSVTGDLCPAGWHLPKGGNKNNSANSEFWALATASIGAEPANTLSETQSYYTGDPEGTNASKVFRQFPNNFVYSGFISSSPQSRGSFGGYWSSSTIGSVSAYCLKLESSRVHPGTSHFPKNRGQSVRCITQ